jgi:hypothetical protein
MIPIIFFIAGCATEPELDWHRLEEYVFVECRLSTNESPHIDEQNREYWQSVGIYRLRPQVAFVFDPDQDNSSGISGAAVRIQAQDTSYVFTDVGDGEYRWYGSEQFVVRGESYELHITLPDGHQLYAETIAPQIYFTDESDTIRVWPDSITTWSTPPWASPQPIGVAGPHYYHELHFRLTPGVKLVWPRAKGRFEEDWYTGIWHKIDWIDSTVYIYTATDSLSRFLEKFTEADTLPKLRIWFYGQHQVEWDFDHTPDNGAVPNLEEISNIEGGYGSFYVHGFSVHKSFVLALRKEGL